MLAPGSNINDGSCYGETFSNSREARAMAKVQMAREEAAAQVA
jgi:hypothetical protein